VSTDRDQRIAAQNGVNGVPTFFFYKQGRLVDRVVGAVPRTELQHRLDALLLA
jgi:thioredoxin-like negative regulator of GroEL